MSFRPCGTTFFAPIPADLDPALPGDVITFASSHYNPGSAPVNPELRRIRKDVTWRDVVAQVHTDANMSGTEEKVRRALRQDPLRKASGHWTENGNKNIREFFVEFAGDHNPNNPETWYDVTYDDVVHAGV